MLLVAVLSLARLLCCDTVRAEVRKPVVAGSFYPADSTALARMVHDHLEQASDLPAVKGRIVALIVPHAGLVYSGAIAACAYKLLEESKVNTVILCGPSHHYGFEGVSVYGPGVVWQTPLGTVPCDDSLCRRLVNSSDRLAVIRNAHAREHSLEVQLPYLQTVLGTFRLVPITMGYPTGTTVEALADALANLDIDEHTVLIASSDWQHYRPASDGWPMDSLGMDCLKHLDADRLESYLQSGRVEACGGGAVVAVVKAAVAHGATRIKILRYGDSGDVSGDKSSVVGYVAAVLYATTGEESGQGNDRAEKAQGRPQPAPTFELSQAEKKTLLEVARTSIRRYLTDGSLPEFEVTENLQRPGAAFVTLKKHGQLRGCIGHTVASEPLYRTVSTCAVQAAVADPRFQPLKLPELDSVEIEISVLTPLQDVNILEEIEVGRDGLMISMGKRRGLLLPQVAAEYGWDRVQFLRQTCLKAGLPTDAYKSPHAHIQKFQAVVFHEER